MKGCEALLLLLLCLSGTEAQGHNGLLNERHTHDQPGDLLQPDLWGELKELRDMVVVQQEKIRSMEARVAASEERLVASQERLAVSEERLAASEEKAKTQGMFMAGKHGHNGAGRSL